MRRAAVAGGVLIALAGLVSLQAPPRNDGDCGSYDTFIRDVRQSMNAGTGTFDEFSHLREQTCLVDAFHRGDRAELTVVRPTIEGDPVFVRYRVVEPGMLEVVEDSTRDTFGSGRIRTYRCRSIATSPDGIPDYSGCGVLAPAP